MKSTDTILGAFAVLGFALLAFFAFAGSTSDSVINTDDIDVGDELVLTTNESEVGSNDEIIVLEEEEVLVAESDVQVETLTNELLANNLVNDLDPQDIRNSVQDFLAGNNTELQQQVLGTSNLNTTTELENEITTEAELEAEADDEDIFTEDEIEVADKEPGRISRFFSGLFDGNDSDDLPDMGGDTEMTDDIDIDFEELDTNDTLSNGTYVVNAGDTVWDILIDNGMTAAQAGSAIQDMRNETNLASDFGITSGSADLIFPGQTLNLSALS